MNEQAQVEIAQKILSELYDAWEGSRHLHPSTVQDQGGWIGSVFHTAVGKLQDQGLISISTTIPYTIEITPAGIFYAEENGIVPRHKVERHRKVRQHVLLFLERQYDRRNNNYAPAHIDEIAGDVPDEVSISKDLWLLTALGTISLVTSHSYRINRVGVRTYPYAEVDWRDEQVEPQTLDSHSADFLIVWDPEVVERDDYALLITALGDLVRSEGGIGVRRMGHLWVGIPVSEGTLV